MKNTLLLLLLVVGLNALGQNTYKNINKSTSPYGINSFGNMYIGDSTLTSLFTWVFYGSSLTASPGPCSLIGWVAQMAAERQFIPVDSAIPGTGISPNCPVNPTLAMIHRISGFPFHTTGGKFFFDAGVNDVYSDSVAYALALGQILDTLIMNRGWAASDIYVISSFRASTFTDTQLLKVNIKVCAPRGVNIIDVLHPLYYHYHYLGQNTNCPDSTHPTTLGMFIAENIITNSLPFGSFKGNLTTTGNTVHGGTLTVNGTDSLMGKTYLVGGLQQRVNDGHIDEFGIQTNGGDYAEHRFITSNVSAGDTMSLRHTVQAGNGSSFDLYHYKTTGQVLIAHFGGSTDATVLGGSTPLAGYLLTVNGNASMAQANVTAGLYVAGDAVYQDYRLPLFTNGGTHIGIGINSSNLVKFDNAFNGWAFGSGGASFAAKTQILLNGHLQLNVATSVTDTLSAWLQVRGLSFLGDSVNLGRVATGNTTTDSVLMIGTNHYLHKVAASAFGGGGGFTNPMSTTNDMIFQTGGTYARLAAPSHDGMILKSIAGSLGWGDTTANSSSITTNPISATAVTNGVDITSGVLTLHKVDATHGGVLISTGNTLPGETDFLGGSKLGNGTGGNTTFIEGSTVIHIGSAAQQDVFINEAATTSNAHLFVRTATNFNTSDISMHGQLDIDGNFLFNSTSGSTGGRLLVSGGNVFEDAMTSTGGFNFRTNAGGTTLMQLLGSDALQVGTVNDSSAFLQLGANSTSKASIFLNGSAVDVTSPKNGMLWYNSTAHTLNFRDNGVTTNLLAGGVNFYTTDGTLSGNRIVSGGGGSLTLGSGGSNLSSLTVTTSGGTLINGGSLAIGGATYNSSSALLLPASTSTLADINFASGADVTTPNNGSIWYNGINLWFYNNIARKDLIPTKTEADFTGITGNTNLATFTPAAAGTYRVGGYITITAISVDVLQLQVTWTDETNTSRTLALVPIGLTSANLATTGVSVFPTADIRVKSGTAITISGTLTTGTGSITYDGGGSIQLIQ